MIALRPLEQLRLWAALAFAFALCACAGPSPTPSATPALTASPESPVITQTPVAGALPATETPLAYPPPATLTPGPYVAPPTTPGTSPAATPTPTLDPQLLAAATVACTSAGEIARCVDPMLGLAFEPPAAWAPITATLRESDGGAGLAYDYQFGAELHLLAGGRSADFVEVRERLLTDFSGSGPLGFDGASPAEWCQGLVAATCTVVQPNVVLSLRWHHAQEMCQLPEYPNYVGGLAFIWVLPPDSAPIDGFVFVAPYLSAAAVEHVNDLRRDVLGYAPETVDTRCNPDRQAAFDAEVASYMRDLETGVADPATLEIVAGLQHLAVSIQPAP